MWISTLSGRPRGAMYVLAVSIITHLIGMGSMVLWYRQPIRIQAVRGRTANRARVIIRDAMSVTELHGHGVTREMARVSKGTIRKQMAQRPAAQKQKVEKKKAVTLQKQRTGTIDTNKPSPSKSAPQPPIKVVPKQTVSCQPVPVPDRAQQAMLSEPVICAMATGAVAEEGDGTAVRAVLEAFQLVWAPPNGVQIRVPVRIRTRVNVQGRVEDIVVVQPSGAPAFDGAARRAVKEAHMPHVVWGRVLEISFA